MAISGGYYPIWQAMPNVTAVNQNYKHIVLFELYDTGGVNGTGALTWDGTPPAAADLATCRARGQKIILSIGGDAGDMAFTSRTKSQTCVNSIVSRISALGGNVDGIDWDNYEGVAAPNATEYTWMGQQLKTTYGSQFIIRATAGPWRTANSPTDNLVPFFQTLIGAGSLDYVMPMFYADPAFTPNFILNDASEGLGVWGSAVGYDHLLIGFGIDDTLPNDYMTAAECLTTWNSAIAAHPTLAGATLWNIYNDITQTSGPANSYATGTAAAVVAAGGGTPQVLLRGQTNNITYASRTNTVITAPTGIQNGDVLFIFFLAGAAAPPTPTAPTGFVAVSGFPHSVTAGGFTVAAYAWWKTASNESGSYTVTHAVCSSQAYMAAYSGASSSSPFTIAPSYSSAVGPSVSVTGLTTPSSGALVVFINHDWGDTLNDLVPPAGTTPTFTERMDVAPLLYVADGWLTGNTSTGTVTFTSNSAAADPNQTFLLAVQAAGGNVFNSFESVPNGVAITPANTAGADGSVATLTGYPYSTMFGDTSRAMHGSTSLRLNKPTTANCYARWSLTSSATYYVRLYLWMTALPTDATTVARLLNPSGTVLIAVGIATNGYIQVLGRGDLGYPTITTGTASIAFGKWVRLEFKLVSNTTTGSCEYRYWSSPDSVASPDISFISAANLNTGAGDVANIDIGNMPVPAVAGTDFWIDDFYTSTAGWIGPGAGPVFTPTISDVVAGHDLVTPATSAQPTRTFSDNDGVLDAVAPLSITVTHVLSDSTGIRDLVTVSGTTQVGTSAGYIGGYLSGYAEVTASGSVTLTDSVRLGDVVSTGRVVGVPLVDTVGVDDTPAQYWVAVDEAIIDPNGSIDIVAPFGSAPARTFNDPVGLTDTMTFMSSFTWMFTETATATDIVGVAGPGGTTIAVPLADSGVAADQIRNSYIQVTLTDRVGMADIVTPMFAFGLAVSLFDWFWLPDPLTVVSPQRKLTDPTAVRDWLLVIREKHKPPATHTQRKIWVEAPATLAYAHGSRVENVLYQSLTLDLDADDLVLLVVDGTTYAIEEGSGVPVGTQ